MTKTLTDELLQSFKSKAPHEEVVGLKQYFTDNEYDSESRMLDHDHEQKGQSNVENFLNTNQFKILLPIYKQEMYNQHQQQQRMCTLFSNKHMNLQVTLF